MPRLIARSMLSFGNRRVARLLHHRAQRRVGIDVAVRRNAYGRQRDSFEADLTVDGLTGGPFSGVFIRAPRIESVGEGVEVLASLDDVPVLLRHGSVWASSFHPELSGDLRIHQRFVDELHQ